jgi:hypothetical protein
VDLEQVDVIGAQAAQARLELVRERIGPRVAPDRELLSARALGVEEALAARIVPAETGLRQQERALAPPGERAADHALGVPEAVHGRGVDRVHAELERRVDRRQRALVVAAAPVPTADRPRAEGDDGHAELRLPERSPLHARGA